jgi:peptidyl-prolyl cis-trans isomerase-like protein 2
MGLHYFSFITFRSCKHLDGKHTIFGKLVGGNDTLKDIEKVETEAKTDAPLDPFVILSAKVFIDPFEDAEALVEKERKELKKGRCFGLCVVCALII